MRSESINVEIPSVHVFYPKKEKAALIEFIPPGKYLVRVSAKKKVLEYEVEVKSYTESHLLFDLKKMKVSLLKEDKIIAIKTLHVFKDTLHDSKTRCMIPEILMKFLRSLKRCLVSRVEMRHGSGFSS